MLHKFSRGIWGALLVAAPLYIFGTFNHDLWRPAEAREAGIAREMIENGNWVATHLNGRPFLEKPPLYTWLMAGPLLVFGYQDWAVRLPVLFFTLATLAAVYGLARAALPPRAAQASVIALGTMALFLEVNHGAMVDNGLVFFMLAAMWAAFTALETELPRRRRWAAAAFAASAGMAFLCKGGVGVVLIGAALCGYLTHARQWHKIPRLSPAAGFLIFGALAGAWLLALWQRGGAEYFKIFFIHNHCQRLAGTFEPIKVRWYYLPYLLAVAMPWTLVIPAGIQHLRGQSANNPVLRRFALFLLWWVGAMYLVLNIAGEKGQQYLLPLLPPLAVFAGAWVEATFAGSMPPSGWRLHTTRLFAVLATLVSLALPLAPMWLTGERLAGGAVLAAGMAVAGFYTCRGMLRREWRVMWRALAGMAVGAGLTLGWSWEPYLNQCKSMKPLMAALERHLPAEAELWGYKLSENTAGALIFYGHPARPFDDLRALPAQSGAAAFALIVSYPPGRDPADFAEVLPDWQPVFNQEYAGRFYLLLRRAHQPRPGAAAPR